MFCIQLHFSLWYGGLGLGGCTSGDFFSMSNALWWSGPRHKNSFNFKTYTKLRSLYSWCGRILNSNGKYSIHGNKNLTLKLLLKGAVVSSSHPGAACCLDAMRQAQMFEFGGIRFLCNISDFLWRSCDNGLIGLLSWILIYGYRST
jgi:hypothetical protein